MAFYNRGIAQWQGNLINGTNKLSFLSVQNSFFEHLPGDLRHLTFASPCLILTIWKFKMSFSQERAIIALGLHSFRGTLQVAQS